MFNELIASIIEEPFSLECLNDTTQYAQLVSSIKSKLSKKIEPNQSIDNSFFEIKKESLIVYNLNYYFVNKLLRLATKSNPSGFYFDKNITKIKIQFGAINIDSILIFAFLFLYVLKHLRITNVHFAKLAVQTDSTVGLFLSFLQMNKDIEKLTLKNYLNCNCSTINIYAIMLERKATLRKIKMCNMNIEVLGLTTVIKNQSRLESLIFVDSVFVYNSADSLIESNGVNRINNCFGELIHSILNTAIEKFSFTKCNKFFASSTHLSAYELNQLLFLLAKSETLTTFNANDIMNHIPTAFLSKRFTDGITTSPLNKRNSLNLLVHFDNFTLFHLFNIKNYSAIDVGPMDYTSFESLISNLEGARSVKTLICRFNNSYKPYPTHLTFLLNPKLHIKKIHLYNLTYESIDNLLFVLHLNHSIQEFVLCSFHSIIDYQTDEAIRVNSTYSPFYYADNFRVLLPVLFALKTALNKLYHSKRLLLTLSLYIQVKKSKRVYIENKKEYYLQDFEFKSSK